MYWNEAPECCDRKDLEKLQVERLQGLVERRQQQHLTYQFREKQVESVLVRPEQCPDRRGADTDSPCSNQRCQQRACRPQANGYHTADNRQDQHGQHHDAKRNVTTFSNETYGRSRIPDAKRTPEEKVDNKHPAGRGQLDPPLFYCVKPPVGHLKLDINQTSG